MMSVESYANRFRRKLEIQRFRGFHGWLTGSYYCDVVVSEPGAYLCLQDHLQSSWRCWNRGADLPLPESKVSGRKRDRRWTWSRVSGDDNRLNLLGCEFWKAVAVPLFAPQSTSPCYSIQGCNDNMYIVYIGIVLPTIKSTIILFFVVGPGIIHCKFEIYIWYKLCSRLSIKILCWVHKALQPCRWRYWHLVKKSQET